MSDSPRLIPPSDAPLAVVAPSALSDVPRVDAAATAQQAAVWRLLNGIALLVGLTCTVIGAASLYGEHANLSILRALSIDDTAGQASRLPAVYAYPPDLLTNPFISNAVLLAIGLMFMIAFVLRKTPSTGKTVLALAAGFFAIGRLGAFAIFLAEILILPNPFNELLLNEVVPALLVLLLSLTFPALCLAAVWRSSRDRSRPT